MLFLKLPAYPTVRLQAGTTAKDREMSTIFITNEQLYKQAKEPVATASSFVWIGTADIKDLHVHYKGRVQSFPGMLDSLLKKKVAIRLLHAKEPGTNFRRSFDKYPVAIPDH